MIELENIRYITSSIGRSWNISEYFPSLSGRVTLYERSDSAQSSKISGAIPRRHSLEQLSRSYCGRFAIEVLSNQRCGIDLEIAKEADFDWSVNSELFKIAMLAPGEKDLIMSSRFSSDKDLETLIWVSKEAQYEPSKIYSPICWDDMQPNNWQAIHIDFVTKESERLIVWLVSER